MEEIVTLINRARSGDAEAYGELVGKFQDMAYGYAYAFLGDFHLAQDAAQEAFVEAYQSLPNLREEYAFPSWLKRIVHKHCDRLTRRKTLLTAPLDAAVEVASSQPGPAEVVEKRELAQRVQDAIRDLPDKQRMVTTLFYINGYSHQDIAEFLEVPAKTVKSRLHASRSRLRERMIDMVEDELKSKKLTDEFTRKTVEQAVARAAELNSESRYSEAEEVLRDAMTDAPGNPLLLKELNRSMMRGRVYSQNRWEILPELVKQGREILKSSDDEYVRHEIARTLLAIPAMPEAIEFVEHWIELKGADMERVGMLAWAKGCVADYAGAEELWLNVLALSNDAEPDEVLFHIPSIAFALVDCFRSANELPRAQRVARAAWERCRDLGVTSAAVAERLRKHRGIPAEIGWIWIFVQAKLDVGEVAQALLARSSAVGDLISRGTALCIRSWTDDPQAITKEWLQWARDNISSAEYNVLEYYGTSIVHALRVRKLRGEADQLIRATMQLLENARTEQADRYIAYWRHLIAHPMEAIEEKDWGAAEEIVRQRIKEMGIQEGWPGVVIAAARGEPTMPELIQAIEQNGPAEIDEYGMYGWFVIAREAAALGDEATAFDALRKALAYWSNPPYAFSEYWENDAYWGELRNHPEFKAAFDERRRRIGPIYGSLHYFPGW